MLHVLDDSRLSCLFPPCGQPLYGQPLYGQPLYDQALYDQALYGQLLFRQLLCGRIASHSTVESNQTSSTATDWAVSPRMNFENVPTSA